MTSKLDHIGIAVKQLETAIPFYRDILGLSFEGIEEVAEQKVRVAFLALGESRLELLEPTAIDAPLARFLEKHGEGINHIAYRAADIRQALTRLKALGVRLIDDSPRRGAHHSLIAFLHPKATGGVLTELCQLEEENKTPPCFPN
jgi:methylmalonyl-CoA/ethylmalonyl-CoA epimerase